MASKRGLGSFNIPSSSGSSKPIGLNEIMPFISQQAMLQGLQQKQAFGQKTAAQPDPEGLIKKNYNDPSGNQYTNPEAGAQEDIAKESADSIIKGNTALNQLKYGASRFKALQAANQTNSSMPGIMQKGLGVLGQMKGAVGSNPDEQAWNEYSRTVATQLSAAASPRTPTLLVQYYQHALGPANQTQQEFEKRVQNIVHETRARQSAYSGKPYDASEADMTTKDILSTPAAQDPSNFFKENTNSLNQTSQSGRIKVRSLSNNKTGTISSDKFDPSKYARV